MKRRRLLLLAGSAGLGLLAPIVGRADPRECAVPPELLEVSIKLPRVAERLREKKPLTIVAIGGASTRGSAAGGPDLAYPHRLQVALAGLYPGVPIKVSNQGVPRQSARQMVERFPTDVFPEHPVLVIWEAGITDAARGIALDDFAAALQTGIEEVRKHEIDIVLVDMQFSRRTATIIDFEHYLNTIHRIGELNDAYVFPRFAIMRHWSEQNVFNFDEVAERERAQFAARVYECLGRALADAIHNAVQ